MMGNMNRLAVFSLATALVIAAPALAEAPRVSAPVKVTTVEGITEYRLDNGLRVLLAPDESKPTTTVNVTYQVGSRMEKYGETGMAHLLEHLMFKGTPHHPDKTIVQEFAKRGMRYNGSTNVDRTNYFETFTAGDDNLDWVLRMEADRMVNSNVWRKDLDSEMTVVRNEMEMGENNPTRILLEKMTATAYQWHSYGKSTIGARSDVENVNIEHLQAFYRNFYQPDNAVLIVTGKFDAAKTLARIAQYFGGIARPARTLEPLWTVEPVQDGARAVTLSRVGDTPVVAALYHIPQSAGDDFPALQVLGDILGDTPNGRLYKALVQQKLAADVGSVTMGLHDPGYALVLAVLEKEQPRDKAVRALIDTVESIRKMPITEAELRRAQRSIANGIERTLNDPAQFGVRLSESVAAGDWRLLFLNRDRVAALTVADVQRVAERYFKESNRTLGEFIPTAAPDRAVMPPPVDVGKLVADYRGKDAMAAGEAFDPSPANIEKRTKRYALANGMQVAELRKQTRGNTVAGTLLINTGDLNSLMGKKWVAEITGRMLQRGAGKLSRRQIADRLAELDANLNVQSFADHVGISFETKRDQLGELLGLIGELVRYPTFPESELAEIKTEWLTGLEARRHQPEAVAQNALARHDNPYPKGDVRYSETFDEQSDAIKSVNVADLKALHGALYGTDHGQIALVGDFDPSVVEPQLAKLFGGWKARVAYVRVPRPYLAGSSASQQLETPDKANAFYTARLDIPLRDDDAAIESLLLGDRILGSGGLKSRIADRLRQKDGISYGAGSGLSLDPYEANSTLVLSAIYAPQNLPKLKADIADVLTTLLQDGVTEQELAEAKSGLLQNWSVGRTQDAPLSTQLANQMKIGRTMNFVEARETKVQAASMEDVNRALRKYIALDRLVQIYAGDFTYADKASGQ
jgi:zinc protease